MHISAGWGRIINISSTMGVVSQEGKAPYSAAKSALIGLTKVNQCRPYR